MFETRNHSTLRFATAKIAKTLMCAYDISDLQRFNDPVEFETHIPVSCRFPCSTS
jgi:hypothetical protein